MESCNGTVRNGENWNIVFLAGSKQEPGVRSVKAARLLRAAHKVEAKRRALTCLPRSVHSGGKNGGRKPMPHSRFRRDFPALSFPPALAIVPWPVPACPRRRARSAPAFAPGLAARRWPARIAD